jgi:hypothetical protein
VGQLEDHYRRQAQAAQAAIPPFHQAYNDLVSIWTQIRARYLAGINRKPPARCEWIALDGQQFACWDLWRDYEYENFLYFISDGRVVATGERMSNPRVLDIRPVPRSMTLAQIEQTGRAGIGPLRTLCLSALTLHTNYTSDIGKQEWSDWNRVVKETQAGHYYREMLG